MTLPTVETQAAIAEYRRKDAEGTMTLEDYKGVIRLLRGERMSAQTTAKPSKAVKTEGLLDDFLG